MMLTVLSLGAGVQSSTLALLAAHGEVTPMPDAAIFADTGAEPAAVYAWLDWLEPRLPYPVYRVREGDGLRANVLQPLRQSRKATLPAWTPGPSGVGQLRRQCTQHYKLVPIRRKLRELLGLRPGQRAPKEPAVELWLGISLDEIYRAKPAREPWIRHRWPLVFDRPMRRSDCLAWMRQYGYPEPPRSACVFCPYRSGQEWRHLRDTDAEGWRMAVEVDEEIRAGVRNRPEPLYLHNSLRPLAEVDLRTEAERGQQELWGSECEGLCAV